MSKKLKSFFLGFPIGFWISSIVILLLSVTLGYGLVSQWIFSDYPAHINIHQQYLDLGKFPFPSGFYLTYSFFAFFSPYEQHLKFGMIAVTVLSIYWRYYLSFAYLKNQNGSNFSAYLALGLIFFAPAYFYEAEGSNFLLGKYSTAYWHSATLTLVWPFCILLYYTSLSYVERGRNKDLFWMYLISFPILLTKPSFLFCLVPALPLFAFLEKGTGKEFYQATIYSLVIFGIILLEKWWIFDANSIDPFIYGEGSKNEVKVLPLAVWKYFSKSPIRDFFSSFLFLIFSMAFFGKALFARSDFRLALGLSLVGILIYLLLAEEGPRFIDGNFGWQIPLSLYVLYLSILKYLVENWSHLLSQKPSRIRLTVLGGVFLVHCLSGVNYLVHYFQTGYYF